MQWLFELVAQAVRWARGEFIAPDPQDDQEDWWGCDVEDDGPRRRAMCLWCLTPLGADDRTGVCVECQIEIGGSD